jgi:DNA-directed RNA polymerase subunit beta'
MKHRDENGVSRNIKTEPKSLDRESPEVWDALEINIKGYSFLLNHAQILQILGIRTFEQILVEGHAIKLLLFVCISYNTDYDGDQMQFIWSFLWKSK